MSPDEEREALQRRGCRRAAERLVGCPTEDHRDLGDPLAEPLAGAQVEGHAGPPAGLHVQPERGIRLGRLSR